MNYKSFVIAWMESYNKKSGVANVAKRMDISVEKVSSKANYLRKKGVDLPPMPRAVGLEYSVEELNELIASKM